MLTLECRINGGGGGVLKIGDYIGQKQRITPQGVIKMRRINKRPPFY